jgi:hypothetical protein
MNNLLGGGGWVTAWPPKKLGKTELSLQYSSYKPNRAQFISLTVVSSSVDITVMCCKHYKATLAFRSCTNAADLSRTCGLGDRRQSSRSV